MSRAGTRFVRDEACLGLDVSEVDGRCVVFLTGALDGAQARRLCSCLEALADRGWRRFVLDTAEVRIVELTGVEVLLATLTTLRERGAHIILHRSEDGAYRALERIGFRVAPMIWSSLCTTPESPEAVTGQAKNDVPEAGD